ncbi:hypothetical protein D0T60_09225 [Bacteroides sp. 224]|nr:hypothetical protein [Bacteroides sp. 224]
MAYCLEFGYSFKLLSPPGWRRLPHLGVSELYTRMEKSAPPGCGKIFQIVSKNYETNLIRFKRFLSVCIKHFDKLKLKTIFA